MIFFFNQNGFHSTVVETFQPDHTVLRATVTGRASMPCWLTYLPSLPWSELFLFVSDIQVCTVRYNKPQSCLCLAGPGYDLHPVHHHLHHLVVPEHPA